MFQFSSNNVSTEQCCLWAANLLCERQEVVFFHETESLTFIISLQLVYLLTKAIRDCAVRWSTMQRKNNELIVSKWRPSKRGKMYCAHDFGTGRFWRFHDIKRFVSCSMSEKNIYNVQCEKLCNDATWMFWNSYLRSLDSSTQLWWSQNVSSCSWKNTDHEHFHIVWLNYRLTALHVNIVCVCVFEMVVYLIQCVLRILRLINQSNNNSLLTEFHSSLYHIIYCLFSKEITLSQWFIKCPATSTPHVLVSGNWRNSPNETTVGAVNASWELQEFVEVHIENCPNCEHRAPRIFLSSGTRMGIEIL